MSRVLIAIGCDKYDDPSWGNLTGAENDAKNIYNSLVVDGFGQFNAEQSKLLLSPSLSKLRSAISEVLFSGSRIECLTLFYAGHGEVKDGTYFLTCRDSLVDQLSLSALSTSVLFSYLNEAKCEHTNIIIDSCFSAGLVHDLGALLKPEIVGKRNALSLSILAAASSNEPASEDNGQGYCTKAILDCLNGNIEIPSTRSTLDLIDVGLAVSAAIASQYDQNPECWGISLKGHVPFCTNPNFIGEATYSSHLTSLPSEVTELVDKNSDRIWAAYFNFDENYDPDELFDSISECIDSVEDYPEVAANLAMGVANSFRQKISDVHTGFLEAEITGIAITSILKLSTDDFSVQNTIALMCDEVQASVSKGILFLNASLKNDVYSLLSSGFAELYYLPIRISKILGWIGVAVHIADTNGTALDIGPIKDLVQKIIGEYSRSVFSVSDTQTPYLASFISSGLKMNLIEEAETITALMFNSFLEVEGRIAATSMSADEIVKYVMSTEVAASKTSENMNLAKPSELLALFFVLYRNFGMDDELDRCLEGLDHNHFNIYVPENYHHFADELMRGGQNYSFQIGHGVWKLADFQNRWLEIDSHLDRASSSMSDATKLGAIISSMIKPDRVPWFLFKSTP
jgi:hypothetical protein